MKQQAFAYEFGGPVGTFCNIVLLPILTLFLIEWSHVGKVEIPTRFPVDFANTALLTRCTLGALAWFLFQVVLERILPCQLLKGTVVLNSPKKERLEYRINGHLAFWTTWFFLQVGGPYWHADSQTWQFTSIPLAGLYDCTAEIAFVVCVMCFFLSLYLYLSSFIGNKVLATPGNSGNAVYDFWMGRELNPRIGNFDWKEFCELRPGLIGWMLLNVACLQKQQQTLGYVTGSMMLLNAFQGLYVWDALYQEPAILTTMDITTDGFGYMLVFGDMAWVPFTYSVSANEQSMGSLAALTS